MNARLYGAARTDLTPSEALAWWCSAADPAGDPVGFGLSAAAATWWRMNGAIACDATGAPADLAAVYELVGFDGSTQVRWRDDSAGRGRAVVFADDISLLPSGESLDRAAMPLDARQQRMLAGRVQPWRSEGWVRLTAARYAPAVLPIRLPPDADGGDRGAGALTAVLESVEYAAEDEHGNVTVVDRRHTRLLLRSRRELSFDIRPAGDARAGGEV